MLAECPLPTQNVANWKSREPSQGDPKPVAPCPRVTAPWIRRTGRGAQMLRAAVIVALLLAVAFFAWRGVGRALTDSGDLAVG